MTDDEIRARAHETTRALFDEDIVRPELEFDEPSFDLFADIIATALREVARETREQCAREAGAVVGGDGATTHYDRFSSTDSHCRVCGSPTVEQDGEHFTNGVRNRVRGCKNGGCSSRMLDPTNEACLRQGHDWSWGFLGGYDRCRRCGCLYGGI